MTRRRNKNRIRELAKSQIVIQPTPKKSWLAKKWGSLSKIEKIIGVVVLIGTGILTYVELYDRFFPQPEYKDDTITPKDRFKKDNIDTGLLKGTPLFKNYDIESLFPENSAPIITQAVIDSYPPVKGILIKNPAAKGIILRFGDNDLFYPMSKYFNGFSVSVSTFSSYKADSYIYFGVKNNRLYVSLKFKDFTTGNLIGFIEFNKWKLYLDNLLDYNDDNERLEVIDKKGNIVLSLKYEQVQNNDEPLIKINGYFISDEYITVLNDNGQFSGRGYRSPADKKAALKQIESIKSVF